MSALLMTEREWCEATRLSRATLRRLMAAGKVRPLRIGRAIRFPAADLAQFIAELRQQSEGESSNAR